MKNCSRVILVSPILIYKKELRYRIPWRIKGSHRKVVMEMVPAAEAAALLHQLTPLHRHRHQQQVVMQVSSFLILTDIQYPELYGMLPAILSIVRLQILLPMLLQKSSAVYKMIMPLLILLLLRMR